MKNCVFCKIINKEIKSNIVYEDESIIAFLDINPVSEKHTLIVPKKHYENIYDIPEELLSKLTKVAKKLAIEYKQKYNITNLNLLNANGKNAQQSVFHYHLHLVPRKEKDGLNLWIK